MSVDEERVKWWSLNEPQIRRICAALVGDPLRDLQEITGIEIRVWRRPLAPSAHAEDHRGLVDEGSTPTLDSRIDLEGR